MPINLEDARTIAATEEAEWAAQHAEWEACKEDHAIEAHFARRSKSELIRMWETDRNDAKQPLSAFEWKALCAAWYLAFGSLPPMGEYGIAAPGDGKMPRCDAPAHCVDVPERLLSPKAVAELTGISVSTLKRMVQDHRLPMPMRVSPRRIAWAPADVRAILAMMDGKRRDVRKAS
jgi:predicted DNA-binding transcriptional regulator AlpA